MLAARAPAQEAGVIADSGPARCERTDAVATLGNGALGMEISLSGEGPVQPGPEVQVWDLQPE